MDLELINRALADRYGRNLVGQPIFRIVFSDDLIEKRIGRFADYYGKIFVREYVGMREVPKYSYLKAKYVIERWYPPSIVYDANIPDSKNGSYEPIYVFQDDKGNSLDVVEDVVHIVIKQSINPNQPGHQHSLDKTTEQAAFDAEVEHNKEVISEAGRTWIGHRLHSGEAIIKK